MPGKAAKVRLSECQKEILETIVRRSTSEQRLVVRAWMILLGFEGKLNEVIAEELGMCAAQVGQWRRRWADNWDRLIAIECGEGLKVLEKAIEELLRDAPRSGSPGKFTAEQVTQILAVACEDPEESGRPVTHWTPSELADEVQKRGIVESISIRQVGRFLKSGRPETASHRLLAKCENRRPGTVSA
jgi:transposase